MNPRLQAARSFAVALILMMRSIATADEQPKSSVRIRSLMMKEFDLPPQMAIAFSPNGKYIATGGIRGGYVWDSTTLARVQTIALDRMAQSAVFDADSKHLFLQSDEDSHDRGTSIFWCEVGQQTRTHRWKGGEANIESAPINGALCAAGRREILLVNPQLNESKTIYAYPESEIPIRCIRPLDDVFVWTSKAKTAGGAWLQRLNAGGELLREIKLNAEPRNVDLLDCCGTSIVVCGNVSEQEYTSFVDVFDPLELKLQQRILLSNCYRLQGSTMLNERLLCIVTEGPHPGDAERSECDGSLIVVDVHSGKVVLKQWLRDSVEKVAYSPQTKTLVTLQGAPSNGTDFRLQVWKVELE